MNLSEELYKAPLFQNLELLARQIVEGYISGIHKSPFHGYSAEFAEHSAYNPGESTKHIDWKLYARTDKLYTKRYEEETNLRCHFILDNSSSMHYPPLKEQRLEALNKIGFGVLSIAALMEFLKKQRDAVGLSIFSEAYDYYAPEKGSERHRRMLLAQLEAACNRPPKQRSTEIHSSLHEIAEKLKRRSLVMLFSDLWESGRDERRLFEALRHLKYNKHEVVVFHLLDGKTETTFDFGDQPKRFIDVESGEHIDLYSEQVRDAYVSRVAAFMEQVKLQCARYRITYVPVDIRQDLAKVLNAFMVELQQFR